MSSRAPSRSITPLTGLRRLQPAVGVVPFLRAPHPAVISATPVPTTHVCTVAAPSTTLLPTTALISTARPIATTRAAPCIAHATRLVDDAAIVPTGATTPIKARQPVTTTRSDPVTVATSASILPTTALISTARPIATTRAAPCIARATRLIGAAPIILTIRVRQPVATTRSDPVIVATPTSILPTPMLIGTAQPVTTTRSGPVILAPPINVLPTAALIDAAQLIAIVDGSVVASRPIEPAVTVAVVFGRAAATGFLLPTAISLIGAAVIVLGIAPRGAPAPDAADFTWAATMATLGDTLRVVAAQFAAWFAGRAATVVALGSAATPGTVVTPTHALVITGTAAIGSLGATTAITAALVATLTGRARLGSLPLTAAGLPSVPVSGRSQLDDVPYPVTVDGDHQIRSRRPQSIRHPVERT
ncbi:hypothetical protein [Nocardia sp. NPDC050175]|uniref:hypothetical protein n=1 Tax=Nocardia sp. NPDC050175 TaxID=3364317 RepID=UPI0037BD8C55